MHVLWQGSISFGLVSFPVKLYSALKKEVSFHLFHKKDKGRIKYAHICEKEKKEVPWEEIIKGYEITENKYVYLEDEDFEKAHIEKTKTIDILGFIEEDKIDSILFHKPYYLVGQYKNKAYFLFSDALKETKKIALCRFILHNREHIGIIKPLGDLLILLQLHYIDEMRSIKDLKISSSSKTSKKELELAKKLINSMEFKFDPKKYRDPFLENIKEAICKKGRGIKKVAKKIKFAAPSKLSALLEKSIKGKKKSA